MDKLNRRKALQVLGAAGAAASISWTEAEAQQAHQHAQQARRSAAGAKAAYKPKYFTAHELATVTMLANLIIPKDEKLSSPTFPFIGSWELRRDITYAYIECLGEHCGRQGIPFLALAGKYHPPMEKAERSLFHDGTHLSQRLMPLALEELQKAGVLKL